jgi:hypothetical protein
MIESINTLYNIITILSRPVGVLLVNKQLTDHQRD